MRRILIINHANPFAKGGGSYATRAYMKAFAEWAGGGADICIDAESPFVEDKTIMAAKYIKVPKRSIFQRVFSIINGDIQRYSSFIENHLAYDNSDYEWAIISGSFEGGALVDLFHRYGIRVLTIHHNYEPEYIFDNTSTPVLKNILRFHAFKLQKKAYKNSNINLFLTNEDIRTCEIQFGITQAMNYLIGVFEFDNIPLLPNTLKNEYPVYVITGQLNNAQGIDSIEYFLNKLLPFIPTTSKIIISGKNPSKGLISKCRKYKNIELVPNPDEMRSVISSGDIYICPTRVGGGLKLRIMDGLKMGLPVIVHKCSARGYDVYQGSPFFKSFITPEEFRKCVEEIENMYYQHSINKGIIYRTYLKTFSYAAGLDRICSIMNKK